MFLTKNKIVTFINESFFVVKINSLLVLGFALSILPVQATQVSHYSLESLTQVVQQCRQKVDALWQVQKRIPSNRRRDFHVAIGLASKSCDELTDLLNQFEQAHHLKRIYEKSLREAENLAQLSREVR